VYYHELDGDDPLRLVAATQKGIVGIMDKIDRQLRKAYPNCAPLRRELNKLAVAKAFTTKAKRFG
jgi:hypothetical protein